MRNLTPPQQAKVRWLRRKGWHRLTYNDVPFVAMTTWTRPVPLVHRFIYVPDPRGTIILIDHDGRIIKGKV